MAEKDENLDMGLFDSTSEIELNFADMGIVPDADEDKDIDAPELDEDGNPVSDPVGDEDNIDEDADPEGVVGDEDNEEGDEDAEGDNSPNIYSSFAAALNEKGLLPSLDSFEDTEINSVDDLATVFKSEIETQVKSSLIEQVGEKGYEALQKGITLAEYQQYEDNVMTLDGITEETLESDIELSKKVIYQDYLAQGLDEARAVRLLNKSIDAGDEFVLEDAKESLESLKVTENKRLDQLTATREAAKQADILEQEKIDNDLKSAIYNTPEIIKGIKVNKTIQDKVYKSINTIVGKSPSGVMENQLMKDRRENPVDFDSKLYYLYELTKGFEDFSKLVSKSESKAVGKLERALKGAKFDTGSGKPAYMTDPNSYGGIGSELIL